MNYNKEAHKVYSLNYHLIIVVKYRKKVFLNEDLVNEFKTMSEKISNDFDVKILEQECGSDHVHMVFSAKPTLDIPNYINILKGHTSRNIRKNNKIFLEDKLQGDSFWSPSYFIASTGNVSLDVLMQYVENQRQNLD